MYPSEVSNENAMALERFASAAVQTAPHQPDPQTVPLLSRGALDAPTNAFCITLYNEEEAAFKETIRAVLISLQHFRSRSAYPSDCSTICVIIDGRDRVDLANVALLERCRAIAEDSIRRVDEMEVYSTFHRIDLLLSHLDERTELSPPVHVPEVQIVVCLKNQNAGKMHSHSVFFDRFCRELQPLFCYQVDTGTTMCPETILQLTDRMAARPNVAAIAPRVVPAVPKSNDRLLATWQFTDLALRNGVTWPAEVFAGFLSVVPGQTGIFRWRALQSSAALGCATGASSDVVSAYLQGAQANGPIARMMYLAEDRVIGILLYFAQRDEWKLDYLPEAVATTDTCQTFGELFRQRRRWNNSALACRLWLLRNWPEYLKRNDRTLTRKTRFSAALLLQVLVSLRDFLSPAYIAVFVTVLTQAAINAPNASSSWLSLAFWATTSLELALVGLPAQKLRPWARIPCMLARRWIGWLGGALLLSFILSAFAPLAAAILLAPMIALLPAWVLLPRESMELLTRSHISPIPSLLMTTLTQAYSFWKLHDISWGTKGLLQSASDRRLQRGLRHLRHSLVCVWLGANAALIVIALLLPGLFSNELNPTVEIACLLDLLFALLAVIYLVRSKLRGAAFTTT